jgi:F-type H+-transporting ATPase subunit a
MAHKHTWQQRVLFLALVLAACVLALTGSVQAQDSAHSADQHSAKTEAIVGAEEATGHDIAPRDGSTPKAAHGEDSHGEGAHGEGEHKEKGTFSPHFGTWLNPVSRALFGQPPVHAEKVGDEMHFTSIENDFIVVALFIMLMIGLLGIIAARQMKMRPDGKPFSLTHVVETLAEGFRNYLVGVMGEKLAYKYAPLVSSFFFTILLFNYMGQIPGMTSPTANPNVPIAFAIIAFFSVHIIAIKEAGFKNWFMHLVGEPLWLAPLNFPLHLIGELIKPLSLAMRLLGNIFGEEMVVFQLIGLSIGIFIATSIPIPIQLPMMFLGLLFGLLQALVFSTLLAIYIAILGTHHDDHDEHNAHGHVEHRRDEEGHRQVIAHPSEITIA